MDSGIQEFREKLKVNRQLWLSIINVYFFLTMVVYCTESSQIGFTYSFNCHELVNIPFLRLISELMQVVSFKILMVSKKIYNAQKLDSIGLIV